MLQQLNVHPSSPLGLRFSELWGAGESAAGAGAPADGRSFALVLLEALAEVHAAAPRHEAETQTRNGPAGSSLNDMSLEMERLEAKFAGHLERQRTEARLDFDRQMVEHRAEADRVSRAELDARVEKVREIEVGAARVSEAARYQERLAHEKAEMEKLHRFQLSKLREKEIQMTDRLMQQQRKIDATTGGKWSAKVQRCKRAVPSTRRGSPKLGRRRRPVRLRLRSASKSTCTTTVCAR